MERLFPDNWPDWLVLITIIAGSMVIGLILKWIIFGLLRRQAKRYDSFVLGAICNRLSAPMNWFFPLLFASFGFNLWQIDQNEALDGIELAFRIVLYIVGAWIIIRIVSIVADAIRNQHDIHDDHDNLEERKILTQLQYIQRIAGIVVVTITAAMILMQFPGVKEIGQGLLTSAGVAGIIIGVAAQKSIANLLAGLQIAFTQPIRLDDVVIVEGEWGRIEEITLTYVVVRIWDQRRLVVPLQYFNEQSFQNWTRTNSDLLGTVFLYVDYSLPVSAIREKLDELVANHPKFDGRAKAVQVTDAKADVMEVRVLVSAANAGDAFDLRCDLREGLITFIQTEYPESLPRTRIEMTRPDPNKRQRLKQLEADEPPLTSSPSPEDGKEEMAESERIS